MKFSLRIFAILLLSTISNVSTALPSSGKCRTEKLYTSMESASDLEETYGKGRLVDLSSDVADYNFVSYEVSSDSNTVIVEYFLKFGNELLKIYSDSKQSGKNGMKIEAESFSGSNFLFKKTTPLVNPLSQFNNYVVAIEISREEGQFVLNKDICNNN